MTDHQRAALADAEPTEDCADEMPATFDTSRFLSDFRRPYSVEQADQQQTAPRIPLMTALDFLCNVNVIAKARGLPVAPALSPSELAQVDTAIAAGDTPDTFIDRIVALRTSETPASLIDAARTVTCECSGCRALRAERAS